MDNKQFLILAGVIIGKESNRDQASLFFFFCLFQRVWQSLSRYCIIKEI